MKHNELYDKLEFHYKAFDRSRISPDPLEVLHRYSNREDIEIAGLLSSIFAYGNVNLILRILNSLEIVIKKHPYDFMKSFDYGKDKKLFKGVSYRFYTGTDIANLFRLLNRAVTEFETLENLFMNGFNLNDENVKAGIDNFSGWFIENCKKLNCFTNGIRFMFPMPSKGSAAKRFNLFLRWMVRKDELDFGLWENVKKSQLIIPVDVHISRIARELGLTSKKNVTWKMAEEITGNLKKFDSSDPVKYDFALCHIGMRNLKF